MKVKMKSRQAIVQSTVDPSAKLADTDPRSESFCAQINQQAYLWALERAPNATRSRFDQLGVKMVFEKDVRHFVQIGPVWIYSPLQLKQRWCPRARRWQLHVTVRTLGCVAPHTRRKWSMTLSSLGMSY
jgi:hypothetical protein